MRLRPWLTVAAFAVACVCIWVLCRLVERHWPEIVAAAVMGALLNTGAIAIIQRFRARSTSDDARCGDVVPGLTGRDLRLTLDSLPVFVHATTPSGQIELVNKSVLDYFGLSIEALEDFNTTTHPDDVERVTGDIKRSLLTGMPLATESRGRRADGVYRWFSVRGLPLRNERGDIVRWYNVLTDVDDLKRTQEALRASEQSLRLMVDSIPGLICTNTAQGEVEHVNKTLLDYTGKPLSELLNWIAVIHPDDVPHVSQCWSRSVASGEPFDVEVRVCRGDGAYRWFHCRGLPLRSDDGHILRWYNLLTDIEDRKHAEQSLRDMGARLARATQVATVGEISASIAHEINQPLAALVTNGHVCHDLLSAKTPNIPRALVSLKRIIRDAKSAAEVIKRIRSLYRHAASIKQPLNANVVIAEVCELIASDLRKRSIVLRTALDPALPAVFVDRVQLQQLLVNLTRNAIEAMEAGPPLKELCISSLRGEQEIVVRVRDTGVGTESFEKVFEPFYTTKPNGMGMGLAICRTIVDAHGGRLWAQAGASSGSEFSFALPTMERGTL